MLLDYFFTEPTVSTPARRNFTFGTHGEDYMSGFSQYINDVRRKKRELEVKQIEKTEEIKVEKFSPYADHIKMLALQKAFEMQQAQITFLDNELTDLHRRLQDEDDIKAILMSMNHN